MFNSCIIVTIGDYALFACIGFGCPPCAGGVTQTHTQPPVPTTTVSTTPNCASLPEGLNPYPGRVYTDLYIVCEQGRVLETGICIVDKIFDPVRRRCTYPADPGISIVIYDFFLFCLTPV